MPASFNQGSVNFGPLNDLARTYSLPSFTIPDSDWCMGVQFDLGPMRGNASTFMWICGRSDITNGTGGNDWGIAYTSAENGSIKRILRFTMRSGGTSITTPTGTSFDSSAGVLSNSNQTYWVFFQRNGSTIEYWLCPVGGTATLLGSRTYNASFASRTFGTSSFGKSCRGAIGTWFLGSQALSQANIESIASGTDPDTIISSGNQLRFFSFTSAAASITSDWGTGTASQVGDWTNRPSGSPLQPNVTGNQLRMEYHKSYRVFPRKFSEAKSTPTISGTYHNYTPTDAQYRLIDSTLSTTQDWTDFASFTAGSGEWSGVADILEGGPYYLQVRDKNTTSIQYLGDTPVYVAPVVVSTGQSPMERLDTANPNIDTLTGTLLEQHRSSDVFEPSLQASAETPVGLCNLANQFAADSGGKAVGYMPAAVGGTSIAEWAGFASLTLGSSGTYTVGETVEIRTSGNVLRGTAVVVSSSSTTLVVKNLTVNPAATNLAVGLTSTVSRSISSISLGTLFSETFPLMQSHIDACQIENGDIAFYWLNGAADVATSQSDWATRADAFWDRLQSMCSARGLNPILCIIPHNRQTSSAASANFSIRKIQRDWAVNHADFGTKIFVGWHYTDMQMVNEIEGTAQAGTISSITLPASYEGISSESIGTITIISGTGAGQTRTGTTYSPGTKIQNITPNWDTVPDNTSVFFGYTPGTHQGILGYRSGGIRYGRSIAYRYGYTSLSDQGPSISSCTRNADGTVITVNVSHTSGSALETPNGGASASNVFGFEVSDNGFSSTLTVSSVQITAANRVTITLASPPSNLAALQVRYLWGFPVQGADFQRLQDLVYDNQAIESGRGQMLQTTWEPVNVTEGSSGGGGFSRGGVGGQVARSIARGIAG